MTVRDDIEFARGVAAMRDRELSAGHGRYLGADAALDDDDERCNWCQRGGEMQSFEGRLFCGENCANAWWWEWGSDE